jgi:mannitol-1-phosphate/altronate dehydrogenase
MKHVHVGPGGIGLGLILDLTQQLQCFDTVLAGRESSQISKALKRSGRVLIKKSDTQTERPLERVTLHLYGDDDHNELVDLLAAPDVVLVTYAVGRENLLGAYRDDGKLAGLAIALGNALVRRDSAAPKLTVVACENADLNSQKLSADVCASLSQAGLSDADVLDVTNRALFANTMVDRICQKPVFDGKDVRVLAESFGEWLIEWSGTASPALDAIKHQTARKPSKLRLVSPKEFGLLTTRKYWAVNGLDVVLALYGLRAGWELAREALQDQAGQYFAELFSAVVVIALEQLRLELKLPEPLQEENAAYLDKARQRIAANDTKVSRTLRELIDARRSYGGWTAKFRQRVVDPIRAFLASNPDATEFAPHSLSLLRLTADAWWQLDGVMNRH